MRKIVFCLIAIACLCPTPPAKAECSISGQYSSCFDSDPDFQWCSTNATMQNTSCINQCGDGCGWGYTTNEVVCRALCEQACDNSCERELAGCYEAFCFAW